MLAFALALGLMSSVDMKLKYMCVYVCVNLAHCKPHTSSVMPTEKISTPSALVLLASDIVAKGSRFACPSVIRMAIFVMFGRA